MSTAVLVSHGARVRVVAPPRVMAHVLDRSASFAWVDESEGEADATVRILRIEQDRFAVTSSAAGRTTVSGPRRAVADHALEHVHDLFAVNARNVLFVHAGAFELDGHLVLVPGRSHSGKSTLVATAVERGATYFSDEFAVIDADGLVHPYTRAMSLREPNGRRRHVTVDDLNGRSAATPMPPAVVLATQYDVDATWSPVRVTGSRSALPIIDNTVLARSAPSDTTRMAADVARRTITLIGDRGDAAALLDALALYLDREFDRA
jgi:hypothetical protein